jgi:hypothetical protein
MPSHRSVALLTIRIASETGSNPSGSPPISSCPMKILGCESPPWAPRSRQRPADMLIQSIIERGYLLRVSGNRSGVVDSEAWSAGPKSQRRIGHPSSE